MKDICFPCKVVKNSSQTIGRRSNSTDVQDEEREKHNM
jgi:hypothetical protein